MSVFSIPIAVGNLDGTQFAELEAQVDAAASPNPTHSVIPGDTLAALGVEIADRVSFETGGGAVAEYPIGYATIRLAGQEVIATVIFGPEGAPPLVGMTTLGNAHLAPDPETQRLVPVKGRLGGGPRQLPS